MSDYRRYLLYGHYLKAGSQPSGMPAGNFFTGGGIDNDAGVTQGARYLFQRVGGVIG